MSHIGAASRSLAYEAALDRAESTLGARLRELGLDKAAVMAEVWGETSDEEREANSFVALLAPPADLAQCWATDVLTLHHVAVGASAGIAARQAALTGYQVSADLLSHSKAGHAEQEERVLQQPALACYAHLQAEWRCKRDRRTEALATG